MPTVEFRTGDFFRLIGARPALEEVESKAAMLGTMVEEIDDEKIVVEVFPNRPDMLSVEGFARAYKTFTGLSSGIIDYKVEDMGITLKSSKGVEKLRPHIVCAIVKNLPVDGEIMDSIINMQEALHSSHGRKRAKVAIGIHDFDKTSPPYLYYAEDSGKVSFAPLDFSEEMSAQDVLEKHPKGKAYANLLKDGSKVPIVADRCGVISLPPVINADRTRVVEGSSNLLIEMTGTNRHSLEQALNIVLCSLADRGGQIVSVSVDGKGVDLSPTEIPIKTNYANKLLGLNLSEKEIVSCLEKMGYGIATISEGGVIALVPCYRTDVLHPIDCVEDIAIAYGYENFTPVEPEIAGIGRPLHSEQIFALLKQTALGLGYQEICSFVLTNGKRMDAAKVKDSAVSIKNPRTEEFTIVRSRLIPSMLDAFSNNKKKKLPQKMFELDYVVCGAKSPKNKRMLCLGSLDRELNFSKMQSDVEALLRSFGAAYELKESSSETFINGRCADIMIDGRLAGIFGEVHPQVLDDFGLEYPCLIAEIDLSPLV